MKGQLSIFDVLKLYDTLPNIEDVISMVERKFGLDFRMEKWEFLNNKIVYIHDFSKRSSLEIHDSNYMSDRKRFVSVNYNGINEGFGAPCDDMDRVYEMVESAISRSKK